MKNIKIFSIIGLTSLFFACSEDFLDTEPLTSKLESNFYSTPEEIAEALVGCYDGLQHIYSGGDRHALPLVADVMADLSFAGTGTGDVDNYVMMDEYDINRAPGEINMFNSNWENYYMAIFRVNALLSRIGQVDWEGNEALKGEYESEARFIRAYCYFDMVRMWERVPLLTEPSSDNIPQSGPDEIFQVIAEDLVFAAENGSSITYDQIAPSEHGHANKWAAKGLLARVYLYYTGRYGQTDLVGVISQSEVLTYLEDVIANSGYDLIDNFADLWPAAATYEAVQAGGTLSESTYAGETNKEVIFAIKYTYTSTYDPPNVDGNHWLVMNGLRNTSWPAYGYGQGWGANTVVPEFYLNWDPRDKRRTASIISMEDEGIVLNDLKNQKEYTGYYTKKYIPRCDADGVGLTEIFGADDFIVGQFQDYFVLRFADVLLMAAELGSANAVDYVNRVRERAGYTEPLASVNKDIIYEERMYELAFEGIRYWDLLRYDHTLAYAAEKVSYTGTVRTNAIEIDKVIDGNNLLKTRGLFPIPVDQITLSDGLIKQNEGWE